MQLGFAKAHHEITRRRKVDMALGQGSSPKFGGSPSIFRQLLKLATLNLVHSFSLPRPIIKLHPEEKVAWPWARGAPQYFGVPL